MKTQSAIRNPKSVQDERPTNTSTLAVSIQYALGGPISTPWQVFACDVQNKSGRDLEAVIRIDEEASRTSAVRRETLARGARKRFFLYLPVGDRGNLAWSLQPQYKVTEVGGKDLAKGQVFTRARGWEDNAYMIGLLSGDAGSESAFGLPRQIRGLEANIGRITAATFPDRWIGLAGLDALLIHDAPLDEFTPEQGRALADYVRQGGTVILSPGAAKGWLNHPVLAAFAPIKTGPPRPVREIPTLNRKFGKFRQDDSFLFYPLQNGSPFSAEDYADEILEFKAGFGRTIVLPFDIRRPPFDSWPGLEKMCGDLLARVPRRFMEDRNLALPLSEPARRLGIFQSMSRLINPFPSFMLLLGVAVLFVLVIGPLNYTFLRRIRMTLLLVVTVPAVSFAFLGAILALGYLLKGTSTVTHSLRFLVTQPGLDTARETHLYSLFSPSTRPFDISFDPGTFGMPLDRLYSREYGQRDGDAGRLECESGSAFVFRGVSVGQWESRNLEARAIRPLGKGITWETDRDLVRVINGSPYAIERAVYFEVGRGGFAVPVGAVPAGGQGEVRVGREKYTPVADLGFEPESFGAHLLEPWLESLRQVHRTDQDPTRRTRFLLCVLREDTPTVTIDAATSGRSRHLTLLQVWEGSRD